MKKFITFWTGVVLAGALVASGQNPVTSGNQAGQSGSRKGTEATAISEAAIPSWVNVLQQIFSFADNQKTKVRDYPRNQLQPDGSPHMGQLILSNILKTPLHVSDIIVKHGKPDRTSKGDSDTYQYGPLTFFTKPGDDVIYNLTLPIDLMLCVFSTAKSNK